MNILNRIIYLSGGAIGLIVFGGNIALAAGKPVALVEETTMASGAFQEFDLLQEGTEIDLGAGETIVVGYMTSCQRETITGGKVTIGGKESEVVGGIVAREEVQCTEPRLALTAAESQDSATIAFRGGVKHVFTRTPVLLAVKSLRVTVTSLENEQTWQFEPQDGRIDLAVVMLELQPGASYRIKGDRQTVLVEVDPTATAQKGSPLERVVLVD